MLKSLFKSVVLLSLISTSFAGGMPQNETFKAGKIVCKDRVFDRGELVFDLRNKTLKYEMDNAATFVHNFDFDSVSVTNVSKKRSALKIKGDFTSYIVDGLVDNQYSEGSFKFIANKAKSKDSLFSYKAVFELSTFSGTSGTSMSSLSIKLALKCRTYR
jgi:hypothetical protein